MRIRRRAAWELPDPIPDHGSLRPHVLPSEWPPPSSRAHGRSSAPQFVAGMVAGIAASLAITAWAVHAHRWPGTESFARASAAPQVCPAPPPAAPPAPAVVTAVAPAPDPVAAATPPTVTEKVRKKGKARSKSAIARAAETAAASADSTVTIERRAAQELGEAAPSTRVAGRSAIPTPTATETTAHLADQAAAELSTSLK